jgi:4-carboxymuconolactone decarboxylase
MLARIAPLAPPYPDRVAEDFAALMPPGMPPIALFRTLAKNPRVLRRIRRGGLLDPGSITVRQREIVILRTTARAGAEYEWGVHADFFGGAAGLGDAELTATALAGPDAPCWNEEEALLIRLADELHDDARLSDETWTALGARFAEDQILEILVLAGSYRAISYVVNGTGITLEPGARRFPVRLGDEVAAWSPDRRRASR